MSTNKVSSRHISVLLREVLEFLQVENDNGGHYLDCTLGGAGHSLAILEANPKNTVTAIDRDKRAIERAEVLRERYGDRFTAHQTDFVGLTDCVAGERFDGILADLGLSTDQLYEQRGFSFRDDSELDMRMDESQSLTASEVVNSYDFVALKKVFLRGGVGKESGALAKIIVAARPIKSAKELSELIARSSHGKKTNVHPATVVFQALRMTVNDELANIEALLKTAPKIIKQNGRFAVISFHSTEDAVVTKTMRRWQGREYSALWPTPQDGSGALGTLLTKKAVLPIEQEKENNPSARSARMRVFEFSLVENKEM